jgi:RNA-directed DNA polymerase
LFNASNLRAAYFELNPKAASGVDGESYAAFGENLDANVARLADELRGRRYHAKLIRRAYIPKGKDTTRPLGILTMADKVVQKVAAKILSAIYEQDFLDFSHAYRPHRDIRKAVEETRVALMSTRCSWVVGADLKDCFGSIQHEWVIRMLRERIDDGPFLRLIGKWLRAGVLEKDGQVIHPASGTPQGGIISCMLANVYLHYALDLWFEKKFKTGCQGDAVLVRYADDWTVGFQFHADAGRFYRQSAERLAKFGLTLAREKSSVKEFSRHRKRDVERFDFLGFEFRWGRTRHGSNVVKLRTSRKKLRKSLATWKLWCREHRNKRLKAIFEVANRKLRGYYQYYGVTGNTPSLSEFYSHVKRMLYQTLNKRSERRSYNWRTFNEMLKYYRLLPPRIVWGRRWQVSMKLA